MIYLSGNKYPLHKKSLIFLLSLQLLLIAGCGSVNENITLQDQFVKARIIGTWQTVKSYTDRKETIRFNEDNTFTDTLFNQVPDLPGSLYVNYIAMGSYLVNDFKVLFSNVQLKYYEDLDNPLQTTALEYFDPLVIDMQDEFIFFRRLISLTRVDSGSGLKGKWEINHWAATVDKSSDKKFSGGLATEIFDFLPVSADSGICRYHKTYHFNTTLPGEDSSYNYISKQFYLGIYPLIDTWYSINGTEMTWYGNPNDNMLFEKVN